MTNREFDRWFREFLSSVQGDATPADWDVFVRKLENEESEHDAGFDEGVRNAVSGVGTNLTPDWEHMEHLLDADEIAFDQQVKDSVERFQAPYNPGSWPVLDAKLAEEERTRRRLIAAKIFEILAILIALLTFSNFFPTIRAKIFGPDEELHRQETLTAPDGVSMQEAGEMVSGEESAITANLSDHSGSIASVSRENSASVPESDPDVSSPRNIPAPTDARAHSSKNTRPSVVVNAFEMRLFPVETAEADLDLAAEPAVSAPHSIPVLQSLPGNLSEVRIPERDVLAAASAVIPSTYRSAKVRFGMMTAADVNTLYIPEEHFYSQGRSIRFSEKEIVAGGYSAGASLLFDSKRFLFETGLSYSSKNFGPGRKLFIGSTTDQHQLDFENITLNVISVPAFFHFKIDGTGQWRFYTIGGASMHVIANAHYDLIAENLFTSSAAPPDPMQIQNAREVQRVREHMLDGAEFSTKGYLTAVGGFGLERFINYRTSVFLQPMYQYQIPFFGLIDQNGKHLRNGTIMIGTRISL